MILIKCYNFTGEKYAAKLGENAIRSPLTLAIPLASYLFVPPASIYGKELMEEKLKTQSTIFIFNVD